MGEKLQAALPREQYVDPTTWLQGKHTIFGKVTDAASQAVVEKLASVPTDGRDKPLEDVVIESITIEEA